MDAYSFQAELLCAPCAGKVREDLKTAPGWTFDEAAATWIQGAVPGAKPPNGRPFNVNGYLLDLLGRTAGTDTDTFPSGPHPHGGGESDTPNHCASCGLFLENPLTAHGNAYVVGAILDTFQWPAPGEKRDPRPATLRPAIKDWWPFYRGGLTRHQRAAVDLAVAYNVGGASSVAAEDAVEEAAGLLANSCGSDAAHSMLAALEDTVALLLEILPSPTDGDARTIDTARAAIAKGKKEVA